MSVEIKTPTRTQFEHTEFPCATGLPSCSSSSEVSRLPHNVESARADNKDAFTKLEPAAAKTLSQVQTENEDCFPKGRRASMSRKRRSSEKGPVASGGPPFPFKKRQYCRRSSEREKIILPTRFLLGGCITDPLNLNSLCNADINQSLNEVTPHSSPMPVPKHKNEVEVFIPPNIHDPLSLNSGDTDEAEQVLGKMPSAKKKKNKGKKRKSTDLATGEQLNTTTEEESTVAQPISVVVTDTSQSAKDNADNKVKGFHKIVSPVIPQSSPKPKKRKRNSSECRSLSLDTMNAASAAHAEDSRKTDKQSPVTPQRHRHKQPPLLEPQQAKKKKRKQEIFIHGNYNRYYGYRNPDVATDPRLACIRKEWIQGKEVLDIGCNVGHVSLAIAKNLQPKKIVGMDIDKKLIDAAKKNIRYYLSESITKDKKFPAAFPVTYGPVAAPATQTSESEHYFPNNILFMQSNYVLDRDESVQLQQEEYDVILCLSVTKWMHFNNGDAGLKRAFQRMYRQLRPGGRLILEPQAWASYKRKKKLTPAIHETFQGIRFKPEQFTEYLLSSAVGFSKCEQLASPFNKSKGFVRPILVYTKADTPIPTPVGQEPCSTTPNLVQVQSTPETGSTPFSSYMNPSPAHFEVGSRDETPCSTCHNTPSYVSSTAISPATSGESPAAMEDNTHGDTPSDGTDNP